jgi:hypothetical protein
MCEFNIISFIKENLCQAIYQMDEKFFRLPVSQIDGSQKLTHPERAFCYELYHQLRNVLGDSFDHDLNGEISKVNNEFFKTDKKIPDFIIHRAGNMDNNLVVLEVKGEIVKDGILKDIETLSGFIHNARYQYGIFILFGQSIGHFVTSLQNWFSEPIEDHKFYRQNFHHIFLVLAEKSNETPTVLLLSKVFGL